MDTGAWEGGGSGGKIEPRRLPAPQNSFIVNFLHVKKM